MTELRERNLAGAPWAKFPRAPFLRDKSLDYIAQGLFERELTCVDGNIMPDMGANVNVAYGTNGQALTCTLAALASAGSRQSTVVDNTAASTNFIDALVMLKILTAGTMAAPNIVVLYAYASVDNGTTYPDTVTGTDGAITLNSPTQLRAIGVLQAPTTATSYKGGPFSVASAYGGILPARWGVVVNNQTGAAFGATETNFSKIYQGIYNTVT